jgi:hypothetical protein
MAEHERQHDWVPWSKAAPRRGGCPPPGHHFWEPGRLRGYISGVILCLQPVHIGTGLIVEDEDGQLYKPTAKLCGRPIIPGSTLKGLVRAVIEALTDSCLVVAAAGARERQLLQQAGVDLPRIRACTLNHPCVACRLFGTRPGGREARAYASRLAFFDAEDRDCGAGLTKLSLPNMWPPKSASQGRKFYYHGKLVSGHEPVEAIQAGSRLAWRINFHNLDEAELNLLLVVLFGLHQFLGPDKRQTHVVAFKVGGYKAACLGSIQMLPPPDGPVVRLYENGAHTDLSAEEVVRRIRSGDRPQEFSLQAAERLAEIWSYPKNPQELKQCKYGPSDQGGG